MLFFALFYYCVYHKHPEKCPGDVRAISADNSKDYEQLFYETQKILIVDDLIDTNFTENMINVISALGIKSVKIKGYENEYPKIDCGEFFKGIIQELSLAHVELFLPNITDTRVDRLTMDDVIVSNISKTKLRCNSLKSNIASISCFKPIKAQYITITPIANDNDISTDLIMENINSENNVDLNINYNSLMKLNGHNIVFFFPSINASFTISVNSAIDVSVNMQENVELNVTNTFISTTVRSTRISFNGAEKSVLRFVNAYWSEEQCVDMSIINTNGVTIDVQCSFIPLSINAYSNITILMNIKHSVVNLLRLMNSSFKIIKGYRDPCSLCVKTMWAQNLTVNTQQNITFSILSLFFLNDNNAAENSSTHLEGDGTYEINRIICNNNTFVANKIHLIGASLIYCTISNDYNNKLIIKELTTKTDINLVYTIDNYVEKFTREFLFVEKYKGPIKIIDKSNEKVNNGKAIIDTKFTKEGFVSSISFTRKQIPNYICALASRDIEYKKVCPEYSVPFYPDSDIPSDNISRINYVNRTVISPKMKIGDTVYIEGNAVDQIVFPFNTLQQLTSSKSSILFTSSNITGHILRLVETPIKGVQRITAPSIVLDENIEDIKFIQTEHMLVNIRNTSFYIGDDNVTIGNTVATFTGKKLLSIRCKKESVVNITLNGSALSQLFVRCNYIGTKIDLTVSPTFVHDGLLSFSGSLKIHQSYNPINIFILSLYIRTDEEYPYIYFKSIEIGHSLSTNNILTIRTDLLTIENTFTGVNQRIVFEAKEAIIKSTTKASNELIIATKNITFASNSLSYLNFGKNVSEINVTIMFNLGSIPYVFVKEGLENATVNINMINEGVTEELSFEGWEKINVEVVCGKMIRCDNWTSTWSSNFWAFNGTTRLFDLKCSPSKREPTHRCMTIIKRGNDKTSEEQSAADERSKSFTNHLLIVIFIPLAVIIVIVTIIVIYKRKRFNSFIKDDESITMTSIMTN